MLLPAARPGAMKIRAIFVVFTTVSVQILRIRNSLSRLVKVRSANNGDDCEYFACLAMFTIISLCEYSHSCMREWADYIFAYPPSVATIGTFERGWIAGKRSDRRLASEASSRDDHQAAPDQIREAPGNEYFGRPAATRSCDKQGDGRDSDHHTAGDTNDRLAEAAHF